MPSKLRSRRPAATFMPGRAPLYGPLLLHRRHDRYTVSVALSGADVETVTRQIVLLEAPAHLSELETVLSTTSGEIRRQLRETKIRPTAADDAVLAADYPILPVRRRFWERVLRAVDRAGTGAQLRTQLWIVYDSVKQTADLPVGNVVTSAFLYQHILSNVLRSGVLLQEISDTIARQKL